jgi:hypothetical protein
VVRYSVAEVQITGNDLDFNTSNNIGVLTHDALPPVNGTGFQVGPGISGSWYDSSHDGEGFLIEILPYHGWASVRRQYRSRCP